MAPESGLSGEVNSPLRAARKKHGLTITEIASQIGFDPSYISLVEKNKKRPSDRLLIAYAKALRLSADHFFVILGRGRPVTSRATNIIKAFKEFSLYDPEQAAREFVEIGRRLKQSGATSISDQISRFFHEALASNAVDHLVSIRYSRGHYEALDDDILKCFGPLCCERKIPVRILFRPHSDDNNPEAYFSDIEYLIALQMPFLDAPSNCVTIEAIPNLQTGFFPLDVHLAFPTRGRLCFGSQPFALNASVELRLDDSSQGRFLEHTNALRSYRDRSVLVFGHRDFMAFSEEQVSLISQRERSYIVQRFLGGCTRPPSDFREGTSWYSHYSSLKDRGPIEMGKLIELRLEISKQGRLRNSPGIRQICSKSAVEQWARKGLSVDKPQQTRTVDPRTERLARIDYLRFLVENSSNFELAAVEEQDGQELGWSTGNTDRDLSWSVEGESGVIFETTYRRPNERPWQEAQCIMQSELVAREFKNHFDGIWDRAGPKQKDRASILGWISHLRRLAEESED